MPKASSSISPASAPPLGGRPALRRNQACRQCRKRKLKCDANRPHCTTCVKQWQALVSVPAPAGYTHPTEPQCSYDPVDGLALAPDADPMDKIRALEDQIAHLKSRLDHDSPRISSRSNSPSNATRQGHPSPPFPMSGGIMLPSASLDMDQGSNSYRGTLAPPPPNMGKIEPEPFMSLLFSGWNTDLPDPRILRRLIDIFFRCDPCGARILHRPSLLASLLLNPRDPGFPHIAILHAICASASRWASQEVTTVPDGRRDTFAEYHASKTRQYIDRTMATGVDIFPVLQACILLSWYFYCEGRWVEVWIFAGFITRCAIPLRLNYPGTFAAHGRNAPGAYLPPPRDTRELESRRRTWWMAVMFDRIVSSAGWVHGIDERDIGTELPGRTEDWYAERQIPGNPQDISTSDLFVSHPPAYTDPWLLFVKAMLIFGRVTDFNTRGNLRTSIPPSASQNPFGIPGFQTLDHLVCTVFLESLPALYKSSYGLCDSLEGSLDTDLYMVHITPHAAAITLHTPYIDFADPNSVSTARCTLAAQAILSAYYRLTATSLDISRLHPFVTICWYLAAVVLVRRCKHCIEVNDTDSEQVIWGEINILRIAMLEYGKRCPVGTRQETLLQGLMQEIIRMTSQKQPLQVGLPLYMWSATTVFRPGQGQASTSNGNSHGLVAPLPVTNFNDPVAVALTPSPPPPPPSGGGWSGHHATTPHAAPYL